MYAGREELVATRPVGLFSIWTSCVVIVEEEGKCRLERLKTAQSKGL